MSMFLKNIFWAIIKNIAKHYRVYDFKFNFEREGSVNNGLESLDSVVDLKFRIETVPEEEDTEEEDTTVYFISSLHSTLNNTENTDSSLFVAKSEKGKEDGVYHSVETKLTELNNEMSNREALLIIWFVLKEKLEALKELCWDSIKEAFKWSVKTATQLIIIFILLEVFNFKIVRIIFKNVLENLSN